MLRAVDRDTFLEDPLRALRAVQFAGRLGFSSDPDLVALCREAPLHELPAERVRGEWEKLMLRSAQPSVGMALARRAEVLERVFPLAEGCSPPDVDARLDRLVEASLSPPHQLTLMLACWLGQGTPEAVTACLDVMGLYRMGGVDVRAATLALVAHWQDALDTDTALRTLATHTRIDWVLLLRVAADPGLDPTPIAGRAAALGVLTAPLAPLLQGRDLKTLNIPPGPHMGEILRAVYAKQLDGTLTQRGAALDYASAWYADR